MAKDYVELVDGVYRVAGNRVSLDSIVACFEEGLSPESIVESFPTLTLEETYGAIAFYLGNQAELDAYLRQADETAKVWEAQSRRRNAGLIDRLQRVRDASQIPG